jgi:hypothetical protein
MSVKSIEKMGELLCEMIHFLHKDAQIHNQLLDKADEVCSAFLPDLATMNHSSAAVLAEAAYEAMLSIKGALSNLKKP